MLGREKTVGWIIIKITMKVACMMDFSVPKGRNNKNIFVKSGERTLMRHSNAFSLNLIFPA